MKKIIALLLAVMMVLAMAACAAKTTDTPAPAETDNKTDAVQETATEAAADGKTELNIGVLVWKYSDTYGSSVRVAMDKYAKEIGAEKGLTINLEMQDGNDDQATQNNQADVMFAAGKDHIIINLCDTSAGQYLVDLAKQYNVPISFYNKEPVDSTIVTGSNSIFVGTKPEEAGIMQGEILADLYAADPSRVDKNGDGKVATLEFEGEINNPEAIARTEYSLSTAIEKGVPCEMMTENQVANWDTAKAQEMMTAQIASLGVENIEVVFCNNDDMAIGVIAALNEVGYNLGDGGDEIIEEKDHDSPVLPGTPELPPVQDAKPDATPDAPVLPADPALPAVQDAHALPQTGVNWLAAIGLALSGMTLMITGAFASLLGKNAKH